MKIMRSLVLSVLLVVGWTQALAASQQLYTCGMHPQVIRNEPGDCPICGMNLTPIRDNAAAGGALQITIDPVTIQRMNLKTDLVTRGPVHRDVRLVGTVSYNEAGLHDVTTKYEGWIEKLFVNATWTTVKAGDPLFEIYAPELYNAQLNYLVAVRAEADEAGRLTRAALARLRLFDVAEDFVSELKRTGEARRTYVFRAPADGVVIEKMAVAGQMMKPGERIYRIADLSTVWVLAQIFEGDLPFVHAGQKVTVRPTYGPDRDVSGTVELLLPQVEEQTRAATARVILPNPDGQLRPGMFVDVRLSTQLKDSAVLVPEIAILRSGERDTIFLSRPDGSFEPREIELGARGGDGRYEVLGGLSEGDRVVTSGQFLLDSESQLREGIQKMLRAGSAGAGEGEREGAGEGEGGAGVLPPGVTVHTCPMDIHAHVVSDQPGKCGECSMTLVLASTVAHGKKSEAIWLKQHAH